MDDRPSSRTRAARGQRAGESGWDVSRVKSASYLWTPPEVGAARKRPPTDKALADPDPEADAKKDGAAHPSGALVHKDALPRSSTSSSTRASDAGSSHQVPVSIVYEPIEPSKRRRPLGSLLRPTAQAIHDSARLAHGKSAAAAARSFQHVSPHQGHDELNVAQTRPPECQAAQLPEQGQGPLVRPSGTEEPRPSSRPGGDAPENPEAVHDKYPSLSEGSPSFGLFDERPICASAVYRMLPHTPHFDAIRGSQQSARASVPAPESDESGEMLAALQRIRDACAGIVEGLAGFGNDLVQH